MDIFLMDIPYGTDLRTLKENDIRQLAKFYHEKGKKNW